MGDYVVQIIISYVCLNHMKHFQIFAPMVFFFMFPWSSTQSFVLRIVVTGILPRQVERQSNLMEGLRLKPIELPILVGDLGYLLLTLLTNLGCQPFLPTLHTNVSYKR